MAVVFNLFAHRPVYSNVLAVTDTIRRNARIPIIALYVRVFQRFTRNLWPLPRASKLLSLIKASPAVRSMGEGFFQEWSEGLFTGRDQEW